MSNLHAFMASMPPSRHFPLSSQPIRQMLLDLRAITAEDPLPPQHPRTILLLVPRRPVPPAHLAFGLQPELGQSQQAHRHPLGLARPPDRVPGSPPPPPPHAPAAGPGSRPPAGSERRTTRPSPTRSTAFPHISH